MEKRDRTGTGTLSIFGHQMRFDLADGFPLVTTKKLFTKAIIYELLWFLRGDTNVRWLQDMASASGTNGPMRTAISALSMAINGAPGRPRRRHHRPDRQRHCRDQAQSGFAPADRHGVESGGCRKMALPPCHCLFQFYVANGKFSCQLYQRSADIFLGVPFNIASYALLTLMVAQVTG